VRSYAPTTIVVTIFLFLNSPVFAADICLTPDVLDAFVRAKLVFSGKIVSVTPAPQDSGSRTASDYVVSFEVEKWWKGSGSERVSVVWRTSMFGCAYFPVGEIGENYLVYADPQTTQLASESLAEVSVYNRTSKLVFTRELDQSSSIRFALRLVDSKPPLNRENASEDIRVLSVLMRCTCASSNSSPACMDLPFSSGPHVPVDAQNSSRSSECCECLRRNLKPF